MKITTSQTETGGKFRQIVKVDAHTLAADVSVERGGEDSAPGPHEYFDVSLATCKALTATWYAKKNGIALDRVEARVERDDTNEQKGVYALKVAVKFFGALSDAEKQKLHTVIQKCPIHKLMTTTEVTIETAPLEL